VSDPRLFYAEWGLEQGADPEDVDGWYLANPALGIRISEDFVRAELDAMRATPEQFARERLGVPELSDEEATLVPDWLELVDADSAIVSHHRIALDVSPDRQWAAFAGAGRRKDGRLHVEAWERRPKTDWVLDVGKASWELLHIAIRIQTGSPAGSFIAPLRELGVEVEEVTAAEHAQALGQFLDACANDGLRHPGGAALNAAVKGAVVRSNGDVDVLGRRTSKVDISPFVAAVLALGGVPALERRPKIHTLKGAE
jgi:phage terminase large subunit-like protein